MPGRARSPRPARPAEAGPGTAAPGRRRSSRHRRGRGAPRARPGPGDRPRSARTGRWPRPRARRSRSGRGARRWVTRSCNGHYNATGRRAQARRSGPQPSSSRSTGASARNASPRCEIACFSSAVISAVVGVVAVRDEDRVVAEPAGRRAATGPARRAPGPRPPAPPPTAARAPPRRRSARRGARRARRPPGRARAPGWRRRPAGAGPAGREDARHPVQRVDAQPRVVGDGRQPGRAPPRTGPSSARSRRRSGRPRPRRVRQSGSGSSSTSRPAAPRISASSPSLCALRVASTSRAVMRREPPAGPPSASVQPAVARSSSWSSSARSNGGALRRTLHLDERARHRS